MDVEPAGGNPEMETELSDGEEGQEGSKDLLEGGDEQKEPLASLPDQPAIEKAEDSPKATKAISFLPRNKEELESLMKHIQETVSGNILPKLHRCLIAKVLSSASGSFFLKSLIIYLRTKLHEMPFMKLDVVR